MKTLKYSKDQTAKFIARQLLKIEKYNFDVFYDIAKIMNEFQEKRNISSEKQFTTYHLLIRKTGCDLVLPSDDCYKTYVERTDSIYEMKFLWNEDYFRTGDKFCEIKRIQ